MKKYYRHDADMYIFDEEYGYMLNEATTQDLAWEVEYRADCWCDDHEEEITDNIIQDIIEKVCDEEGIANIEDLIDASYHYFHKDLWKVGQ